jgi:glycosyltransferase involved in cell wall biosynthesis
MNPDLKRLIFVVPDPDKFHSGGNLYNAALINALESFGQNCSIVEPEQLPVADFKKKSIFFWDTLFLSQLAKRQPDCNNWLIVHHLESLYPPVGYTSNQWFQEKEAPLLEKFDRFLVSSTYTAEYLKQRGFSDEKIIVIVPALGMKPEIPQRQFKSVNALIVANLQERKGIEPFLKALVEKDLPEGLTITIAGSAKFEPAYAQRCIELMDKSPVLKKHFRYLGEVAPEGIWKLYDKANLLISTAFMETYGMALQEAAAKGLPLLVLNGGNAPNHIVEGKNGIVCDNMESLIDQLYHFTGNPGLHKKMTTMAAQMTRSNDYTWATAARRLMEQL